MFDDFRKQSEAATFFNDEEVEDEIIEEASNKRFALPEGKILGLTAAQRFVLAFILFVLTILSGTLGLLVFGKVVPVF